MRFTNTSSTLRLPDVAGVIALPLPCRQLAAKLAEAVEALRRGRTPETAPADPAKQAFAKAEKAMKSAVAEFQRLNARCNPSFHQTLTANSRLRSPIPVISFQEKKTLCHKLQTIH